VNLDPCGDVGPRHDMKNTRTYRLILLGIVVLSAILNLLSIKFGLPYVYGRNVEGRIVTIAVNAFSTGDLNPHVAIYPHLQLYLILSGFIPYYIWGLLTGVFHSRADMLAVFQTDPTTLYTMARSTTALFGTGCVGMSSLIARRLYGRTASLAAAILAASAPLLVINSHLVSPDIIMTFFILVSFYFSLNILARGKALDYLLSGAMLGLSFSAKYPGAIAASFVVCAHILRSRSVGREEAAVFAWGRKLSVLSILAGFATITFGIFYDISPFLSLISRRSPEASERIILAIRTLSILLGSVMVALPFLTQRIKVLRDLLYKHRRLGVAAASCALFVFVGSPYLILDATVTVNSLIYHALAESKPFWGSEGTPVGWIQYLHILVDGTSLPFVLLSLTGIAFLLYRHRDTDILLLSFPLIYYAFMGSFDTKFPRYIVPVVPFMAVFCASLIRTLPSVERNMKVTRARALLVAVIPVFALPSLITSLEWDVKTGRVDTRTIAKEWIETNIPKGSTIAIEALGPPLSTSDYEILVYYRDGMKRLADLDPWAHYRLGEAKDARILLDGNVDYVIVNSNSYGNYFRVPRFYPAEHAFYLQLDSQGRLVKRFEAGRDPGPEIKIYSMKAIGS